MAQKAFVDEVIEEIGTQSLAKLGLNIFSLNTYAAYGASAQMTSDTARAYNQHKKNDKFFGQTFEELDIGMQNTKDSLLNTGNKTYTTDTLADIKYAQDFLKSGKKIENLNEKDRQKLEYILAYYKNEVENMNFSDSTLAALAHKHHTTTDTVTFDEKGNVIKTAQLKVIKNTNDLLKDCYLEGENAPDELKMPFDDYKRHRENLEEMIEKGKNSDNPKIIEKAQKAQKALEKLNANNLCNRLMCENPNATAVVFQGVSAGGHILQAGMSDAVVVALSTLANGIVWEINDMFRGKIDSETPVLERIKRLFQRTIEAFQKTFARGAGFGMIDAVVGIVGQIFKSIAKDLKKIWDTTRASAKSIYNGIYDYISGKITNMQELLRVILKSIFSAAAVVGVVALQSTLEAKMIAFLTPVVGVIGASLANILSTILSIVAGAFAVVLSMRSIDMALDAFFGALDYAEFSAKRAEAIITLCAENLPQLIEEREEIEKLIESTHKERLITLESSFADCAIAIENNDDVTYTEALQKINALWGAELKIKTIDDVKEILQQPNRTGCLKW
ncbi:hypothetical protein [Helicobacter rodentium]|uniref:hypothetical protein n=1 Tax=Helicobacter rodentium TaxID=59617 RepID=UPI00047B1DA8|nr:hypothetical protein [Helicobacter rodentium]